MKISGDIKLTEMSLFSRTDAKGLEHTTFSISGVVDGIEFSLNGKVGSNAKELFRVSYANEISEKITHITIRK